MFGGWDFAATDLDSPNYIWVRQGYARGVPMGGDLAHAAPGKKRTFIMEAVADPAGPFLDRVQIIKGWLDGTGNMHEKVMDVAWSGDRKPDPATGQVPLVGSTARFSAARQKFTVAFWLARTPSECKLPRIVTSSGDFPKPMICV